MNIKIDWLGECPVCGDVNHLVETEKGTTNTLYDGDKVECTKCGHSGVIETDGMNAWCEWEDVTEQVIKYNELKLRYRNAIKCLMESNFNDENYLRLRGAI